MITTSISKLPNKKEVVEQLLNEELIILQRIAVYFIGVYFDELKELFFQFKLNPFDIPFCKHELYEFLSKNSKKFNESEMKSLIDFIADVNNYSTIRAKELYRSGKKANIFQILFIPFAKFKINYIFKFGFLDGVPGFIYAFMMTFHSFLVRAKLYQYQKLDG